MATVVIAA